MEILWAIIVLIISFIFIIWGGDVFVNSSVAIAKKLKVPTTIIGATLVSIGTTIPEILVTLFSISNNASNIAVGNALGSVIFNCCVIGGILLCFTKLIIKKGWHFDYLLLIFSLVATLVYSINGNIGIVGSITLLLLFFVFVTMNIATAVKDKTNIEEQNIDKHSLIYYFIIFVIAAAIVGIGAYFLVEKAKLLAKMAGCSELFIGLTIIAFGTSLPELITTINAIRKKEPGLGLGNIVGANVINSTLLVGLTGIFAGNLPVSKETLFVTLPIAILSNVVLLIPSIKQQQTKKWQGLAILGIYAIYYALLILSAVGIIMV